MSGDAGSGDGGPGPGEGRSGPGDGTRGDGPGPSLPACELLDLAVRVSTMAGDLLAERFHHGREHAVASKSSPTDWVSEADIEAERVIGELLSEERPQDGLLAEEGGKRETASGIEWVVDPLDGTVNFLLGIPHWCVSVAARDADGPLVGAIYDPIRDELFTAARGGEAALECPEKRSLLYPPPPVPKRVRETLCVRERAGLASAMVATGLAYDARVRAAQAEVLARLVPLVRDIRRFGSAALDLAWTAAGRYDAYFERSVKPWDVEAGVLICGCAGLRVVELPEEDGLPWGVLAGTAGVVRGVLEVVGDSGGHSQQF